MAHHDRRQHPQGHGGAVASPTEGHPGAGDGAQMEREHEQAKQAREGDVEEREQHAVAAAVGAAERVGAAVGGRVALGQVQGLPRARDEVTTDPHRAPSTPPGVSGVVPGGGAEPGQPSAAEARSPSARVGNVNPPRTTRERAESSTGPTSDAQPREPQSSRSGPVNGRPVKPGGHTFAGSGVPAGLHEGWPDRPSCRKSEAVTSGRDTRVVAPGNGAPTEPAPTVSPGGGAASPMGLKPVAAGRGVQAADGASRKGAPAGSTPAGSTEAPGPHVGGVATRAATAGASPTTAPEAEGPDGPGSPNRDCGLGPIPRLTDGRHRL